MGQTHLQQLQYKVEYGDPKNRTFKVPVNRVVNGYSFKQITKWAEKWEEPEQKIRNSYRYGQLYREHYKVLCQYLPSKIRSKLKIERIKVIKELHQAQAKYLVSGLNDCIELFKKIQTQMTPDEKYYDSFVWEAKVLFFSFYDFCKPKEKNDDEKV